MHTEDGKMEYFYGVMAFLVILILVFDKYEDRKANEKRVNDILSRFMAKDYQEYATFEHHKQVLDKKEPLIDKGVFEQDRFTVD
jgi:hypothetical protein